MSQPLIFTRDLEDASRISIFAQVAVPFSEQIPNADYIVVGDGYEGDLTEFLENRPLLKVMMPGYGVRSVSQRELVEMSYEKTLEQMLKDIKLQQNALIPTVVVDQNQKLLGQVYSNMQSIELAIQEGRGVYYSRSRNQIWRKGEDSGNVQKLLGIRKDCDGDALVFVVEQTGNFCHLPQESCFGDVPSTGLYKLDATLKSRVSLETEKSYTQRLLKDRTMLHAKIIEEAQELVDAESKEQVASEMADLLYFGLVKCASVEVTLKDVEDVLQSRSLQIKKRPGNPKPQYMTQVTPPLEALELKVQDLSTLTSVQYRKLLQRPLQNINQMQDKVLPIIAAVKAQGDQALIQFAQQYDQVNLQQSQLVLNAPFTVDGLDSQIKDAIDQAYANIRKFHEAQTSQSIEVETMPGVFCSRIARPIESVGLYVPGGSATLPSTALMLGIPAQVAKVQRIVLATPPNKAGTVAPEIVYIARLVGASQILLSGGAQAVAALAYGTANLNKVDKICGPGNQYVTAAKMIVSCDPEACVSIDMPAGPSEVLVIADQQSNPLFVASDLLSQAEHGPDSQVVLLCIGVSKQQLDLIQNQIREQALKLSRLSIIKQSLAKSFCLQMDTIEQALAFSNKYAPEHLILHMQDAKQYVQDIQNAGSVFVGPYSPESVGDYASGTNHTLPTYGYAKQYSGVGVDTFQKWITTQKLTRQGLTNIAQTVVKLAECEQLDGHVNAVLQRLK